MAEELKSKVLKLEKDLNEERLVRQDFECTLANANAEIHSSMKELETALAQAVLHGVCPISSYIEE